MSRKVLFVNIALIVFVFGCLISGIVLLIKKSRNDLDYQLNHIPSQNFFEEDLEDKVYSKVVCVSNITQEYRTIYVDFNVLGREGNYTARYTLQTRNMYHHWEYVDYIYYIEGEVLENE